MTRLTPGQVRKLSADDARLTHRTGDLLFRDVFDEEQGQAMDVTFIRWNPGEEAPFPDPLPYEEVLIVLSGTYTVRTNGAEITAGPGEAIYLAQGASGVYYSDNDATLIAVTTPPYRSAFRKAGRGDEIDDSSAPDVK